MLFLLYCETALITVVNLLLDCSFTFYLRWIWRSLQHRGRNVLLCHYSSTIFQ